MMASWSEVGGAAAPGSSWELTSGRDGSVWGPPSGLDENCGGGGGERAPGGGRWAGGPGGGRSGGMAGQGGGAGRALGGDWGGGGGERAPGGGRSARAPASGQSGGMAGAGASTGAILGSPECSRAEREAVAFGAAAGSFGTVLARHSGTA